MSEIGHVWFVYERFEQLRRLLERWGWEVVERGELSSWDERRRSDPVMGLVRIRGRRRWPLGGHVSFTAKEWWGRPPLQGPQQQRDCVLAGCHYTAQSARGQVRHCFDTIRHPQMPYHVHPDGSEKIGSEPPITVEHVLAAFEQRLAEELYEDVPVELDDEEDTIDAVFGEDSTRKATTRAAVWCPRSPALSWQ